MHVIVLGENTEHQLATVWAQTVNTGSEGLWQHIEKLYEPI
jgi:hypothetical protein